MSELIRNSTVTVDTTNLTIAEDLVTNTQRTFISIANVSAGGQAVFLAFDDEASLNKGIYLAVGGIYTESRDSFSFPTNKRISAISTFAGATLAIQERVIVGGL